MQPKFVAHLELVWDSMLIMLVILLGIGFLQHIMDLLADVLDLFKKYGYFISLREYT